MPADQTTSSDITFSGVVDDPLLIDGALTVGLVIYTVTTSSMSFTEDSSEADSYGLSDGIEFDQILCMEGEFLYALTSSILFAGGATIRGGTLPGAGFNDPPTGFILSVVYRRRMYDNLQFIQTLTSYGGYIVDDRCNPPVLVFNGPSWSRLIGWSTMLDPDWSELGD